MSEGHPGSRYRRHGDAVQRLLPASDTRAMTTHYHAWIRSGRVFTMAPRVFADRTVAHKWAARKRTEKQDRLVLACDDCPMTRPSKRRPPRWSVIAREVAQALGAKPTEVREALASALAAERRRRADELAA